MRDAEIIKPRTIDIIIKILPSLILSVLQPDKEKNKNDFPTKAKRHKKRLLASTVSENVNGDMKHDLDKILEFADSHDKFQIRDIEPLNIDNLERNLSALSATNELKSDRISSFEKFEYSITDKGNKRLALGGYTKMQQDAEQKGQTLNITNSNIFIGDNYGNVNQSLSNDFRPEIKPKTYTTVHPSNTGKKNFLSQSLTWILDHIMQIIIGLIVVYIAFRLGIG